MSLAIIHNEHQIQQMRKACKLAAQTLVMVGKHLKAGMTTNEINTLVHGTRCVIMPFLHRLI